MCGGCLRGRVWHRGHPGEQRWYYVASLSSRGHHARAVEESTGHRSDGDDLWNPVCYPGDEGPQIWQDYQHGFRSRPGGRRVH